MHVEKLFLVWMNESQLRDDSVCEDITCANVRALNVDLITKIQDTCFKDENAFKTSLFEKVKKRKPESTV